MIRCCRCTQWSMSFTSSLILIFMLLLRARQVEGALVASRNTCKTFRWGIPAVEVVHRYHGATMLFSRLFGAEERDQYAKRRQTLHRLPRFRSVAGMSDNDSALKSKNVLPAEMEYVQDVENVTQASIASVSMETNDSDQQPSFIINTTSSSANDVSQPCDKDVPLYRAQGLMAVYKPMNWTSSNVVSYIRGILERDARQRGAKPANVVKSKRKNLDHRKVRVGHGGTLDPLATGVLVIGIGQGTKELQSYLAGPKCYKAVGEFGFETSTLDREGNTTRTAPINHLTPERIEEIIPEFVGSTRQVPPIFSAIRKDGVKLYKQARQGVTADDIDIAPRDVTIYQLRLSSVSLPRFNIEMECSGGTYVRSLIRDIGYRLDSVATTVELERTKQGPFVIADCLARDDWSSDSIYAAVELHNARSKS